MEGSFCTDAGTDIAGAARVRESGVAPVLPNPCRLHELQEVVGNAVKAAAITEKRMSSRMHPKKIVFIRIASTVLFAVLLLFTPAVVRAAVLNWLGAGADDDFNTLANWSPAQKPNAGDDCVVNSTASRQPAILSNAVCGSLTLGTGGTVMTLTFSGSQNLSISGDVTIGSNGRLAPSGIPTGVFTVGGNWSDDLGTTNFTSSNLHFDFVLNGNTKTISTNESFYRVLIGGSIAMNSDLTIADSLTIANTKSLTQGANTIIMNGTSFAINGTYTTTCSSTLVVNSALTEAVNSHFPNVIINSGGHLTTANLSYIDCDMTLQPGGTLTVVGLSLGGDWINNGGTVNVGTSPVYMIGAGKQIRGTTPSTFFNLTIGDGAGDIVTSIFDITVQNNLVVSAGAAFTVQANRNVFAGNNTTVNGTLNLSGTTTWTQTGGGNTAITVAAGGLLSAQGIDTNNRVTFTRAVNLYDIIINGGIDFNYVNVYYTQSASSNRGFSINSPAAATTNFNYVALNFTEDVNNAKMMYWNSNKTITAAGCTFDSSTYSLADADVNVEARTGTINFTAFGGNYAGEALDFDNGGNANWLMSIVKQAWLQNGAAPLATTTTAARGATIVFLIYVRNPNAAAANDVRIVDILDQAGFDYVANSLVRTSAGAPPAALATDKQIFDATAGGTGTAMTDAQDGDVGSALDTGGALGVDRITIGNVPVQANAVLNIAANTTFAFRFQVKVK